MSKRDDPPRTLSRREKARIFLEGNKIYIDLLGAITAAVALLALYHSNMGVRSANEQLELARRDSELARRAHDIQAAQLQPVFQVIFKRQFHKKRVLPPRYSDIRVVSPSGTFLDATARLRPFLVVGYRYAGFSQVWIPPERDFAIISTSRFNFNYSSTVVSDKRGTLIQAWDGDSEVAEKAHYHWRDQGDTRGVDDIRPVVDFVAIVEVSYLDVLRQPHSLYFKVGGVQVSFETLPSLRAAGRAPTLDPAVGKKCFDLYNEDESWQSDGDNLRPLYDTFMNGPHKDLGKTCG